jgi:hypothetical protein
VSEPEKVYQVILREVAAILRQLSAPVDDPSISEAQGKARRIMEDKRAELDASVSELQRHAEWDVFTIALYGETNAGKSTIIETLRILLGEPEKLATRQQFLREQARSGLTEADLEASRDAIQQAEERLAAIRAAADEQGRQLAGYEKAAADTIQRLTLSFEAARETASLVKRILWVFLPPVQARELKNARRRLEQAQADNIRARQQCDEDIAAAIARKTEAEQKYAARMDRLVALEELADGFIIGNGRSDYTTEVRAYEFEAAGQKFALLDVPGIEGKESRVIDQVWQAVRKAHAVFYVTAKAAAPQKGDGNSPGTLEKIASHLGAQTEVWTIFNKRITNPVQLGANPVNGDERDSLDDLDCKMREQLGESYRRTFPLSAQPAFLAVADCLVPQSPAARSRHKFLAKLAVQELLDRSAMQAFRDLLVGELVRGSREKIVRSNYNKARTALGATIASIQAIREERFGPLQADAQREMKGATRQLQTALDTLKSRLDNGCTGEIDRFKNDVEEEMYDYTSGDVDNDRLEPRFKACLETRQATLLERLSAVIRKELGDFEKKTDKIVDRYQAHMSELSDAYDRLDGAGLGQSFDLDIKIDNGIRMAGLLGVVAGAAAMFWFPASWPIMAMTAVSTVIALYKTVRGWLSSDYKRSQQRKVIRENLDRIAGQLHAAMREHLDDAFPKVKEQVERLQEALQAPVRQLAAINQVLDVSAKELTTLSRNIGTAGNA